MANVYKQLGIHMVTAVKHRHAVIDDTWRKRVQYYIETLLQEDKHLPLALHVRPDHIHVFAGMHQSVSVADCVGRWKANLSRFISDELVPDFEWQRGYGAFAVSRRHWDMTIRYINNQAQHHAHQTFDREYRELLTENQIVFDERYLFDEIYIG